MIALGLRPYLSDKEVTKHSTGPQSDAWYWCPDRDQTLGHLLTATSGRLPTLTLVLTVCRSIFAVFLPWAWPFVKADPALGPSFNYCRQTGAKIHVRNFLGAGLKITHQTPPVTQSLLLKGFVPRQPTTTACWPQCHLPACSTVPSTQLVKRFTSKTCHSILTFILPTCYTCPYSAHLLLLPSHVFGNLTSVHSVQTLVFNMLNW